MALQNPATETSVANEALSLIKQPLLLDVLGDQGNVARVVRVHFAGVRDGLLRKYPWGFAEQQALIEASADAPKFGWKYAYPLPNDCACARSVFGWRNNDWKVSGRAVFTDACGPLKLTYTRYALEPALWDAVFRNVFVNALAARVGPQLSAEEERIKACADAATSALIDAFGSDAQEGIDQQEMESDWVTARVAPIGATVFAGGRHRP